MGRPIPCEMCVDEAVPSVYVVPGLEASEPPKWRKLPEWSNLATRSQPARAIVQVPGKNHFRQRARTPNLGGPNIFGLWTPNLGFSRSRTPAFTTFSPMSGGGLLNFGFVRADKTTSREEIEALRTARAVRERGHRPGTHGGAGGGPLGSQTSHSRTWQDSE